MGHHDESLLDKVKNALGMGDHRETHDADAEQGEERAEGWAGVPQALHDEPAPKPDTDADADAESGLGRNPGPIGSARYEGGAAPDAEADLEDEREDRVGTEFGGAYGEDDTPTPTSAAWDRGAPPPEEVAPESDEEEPDRRGTGI